MSPLSADGMTFTGISSAEVVDEMLLLPGFYATQSVKESVFRF
jgi:hypothetical protein